MNLTSLLQLYGLDTSKKIKIARHKDEKRGYDLPRLYKIDQFEIYQSYQAKSDFHGCEYLISFLGTEKSQAVFIGVYKVKSIKNASDVPLPKDFIYYDTYKPNRKYFYELEEIPGFEVFKDRLVIEWSGGAINWIQWLGTREKEIVRLNQPKEDVKPIDYTEDDDGFPEGRIVLKKHLTRERNHVVIKQAKENFIKKHGRLFCEVCGFDFEEHYGDIGEGYIEGHHTKPVSEMADNEKTKVEDIALVCANCHRMLHRKRPWLSMNRLKNLKIMSFS